MTSLWRIVILCGLAANCSAVVAQEIPAASFTIHAKDVDARGLLATVAVIARLNLAIGDELADRRIDVDESHIGAAALIERVAHDQGLASRQIGNMFLVASACRLSQKPDAPAVRNDGEKAVFHFQRIAVELIAGSSGILHSLARMPFDSSAIDGESGLTIVTQFDRLKEYTPKEYLQTVAMVEGWTVQLSDSGSVKFLPNEAAAQCAANAGSHHEALQVVELPGNSSSICPGSRSSGHCSLSGQYNVGEMTALGSIQQDGRPARALIEMPDGLTGALAVGDGIGLNHGKITGIAEDGIHVVEQIQDANGVLKDKPAVLRYPDHPSPRLQ